MSRALLIWSLMYIYQSIYAQNQFSGKILDNELNPIAFAQVIITEEKDNNNVLVGTLTDQDGLFILYEIPSGKYRINVTSKGYQSYNNIIYITSSTEVLSHIELKRDQSVINDPNELGILYNTGTSIDIDRYNVNHLKSALDIINEQSIVDIDTNMNMSLFQNECQFMINGKSIQLSKLDCLNFLNSIPKDDLTKIEINYGNGNFYIDNFNKLSINLSIIPKDGFSFGLGAGGLYSNSKNLHRVFAPILVKYKSKYIDLRLDGHFKENNRSLLIKNNRISIFDDLYFNVSSVENTETSLYNIFTNLSIDYKPTLSDKLEFNVSRNIVDSDYSTIQSMRSLKNADMTKSLTFPQYNEIRKSSENINLSSEYVHHYKRKGFFYRFFSLLNYGNSYNNQGWDSQFDPTLIDAQRFATSFYDHKITNISLDFNIPLNPQNSIVIDIGYIKRVDTLNLKTFYNIKDFKAESMITDKYRYLDQLFLFGVKYKYIAVNNHFHFGFNLGHIASNENFTFSDRSSVKFLPSLEYTKFFTPLQDSLHICYKSDIRQANFFELRPLVDFSDYLYLYRGNPNLHPETKHNLSVSYGRNNRKSNLLATVFVRNTQDAILPYTNQFSFISFFTRFLNIQSVTKLGLEYNYRFKNTDWWDVEVDMTTYLTNMKDKNLNDLRPNLITGCAKITYNLLPWKKGKLQLFANYSSPMALPQGQTNHVYFMDLSLSHMILKGRGRISMVYTDIFDTQSQGINIKSNAFTNSQTIKLDTKAIMLNFGYTFRAKFYEQMINHKFDNTTSIFPFIQ